MRSSIVLLYVAAVLGVVASLAVPSTPVPATAVAPKPVVVDTPKTTPEPQPSVPKPEVKPETPPVVSQPETPTTPAPTTPDPVVVPEPAPAPTPEPVAPTPDPSGPYADGTFYGSTSSNKYQNLQLYITVSGGYISDVGVAQNDASSTRSKQINNDALPQLRDQALGRQSAQLDNISGATYTSETYKSSLQAALDQAYR